jgi:hypothetical protein
MISTSRPSPLFSSQLLHVLKQREKGLLRAAIEAIRLSELLTEAFPRFGVKLKHR